MSETVKSPRYFKGDAKLPLNSIKIVVASFHALHISNRFYVADEGVMITFATQKSKPDSTASNMLIKVKLVAICRTINPI